MSLEAIGFYAMLVIQAGLMTLPVWAALRVWWGWENWSAVGTATIVAVLIGVLYYHLVSGNTYALFGMVILIVAMFVLACLSPSGRLDGTWLAHRFQLPKWLACTAVLLALLGSVLLLWAAWGGTPKALIGVIMLTSWITPQTWAWVVTKDEHLVETYEDFTQIDPTRSADTLVVIVHGADGPEKLESVYRSVATTETDWSKVDPPPEKEMWWATNQAML
jgi:hypothetical protein